MAPPHPRLPHQARPRGARVPAGAPPREGPDAHLVLTASTPPRRPRPVPDDLTAFHWSAAAEGRLEVQRCAACGGRQYPPERVCLACGSTDLAGAEVSGRGTVYSFVVVRQAFDLNFADALPYVVALVELEEDASVRVLTNLVDVTPEAVTVGMAVEVTFEPVDGLQLPQFRPC